jgi:hypothetical protein
MATNPARGKRCGKQQWLRMSSREQTRQEFQLTGTRLDRVLAEPVAAGKSKRGQATEIEVEQEAETAKCTYRQSKNQNLD